MHRIIVTEDGSHTLYNEAVDEYYHSIHGARQESDYIFIQRALMHHQPTHSLSILEVGLGTALNAFLTCLQAEKEKLPIHYRAIERYPLASILAQKLNYAHSDEEKLLFDQIHQSAWGESVILTPYFTLHKEQADLQSWQCEEKYDLIYFDAFSPGKQPELWSETIFEKLYQCTRNEGILITYCAKGIVRRALLQAGYSVERIPGPPGKREILRATRLS